MVKDKVTIYRLLHKPVKIQILFLLITFKAQILQK